MMSAVALGVGFLCYVGYKAYKAYKITSIEVIAVNAEPLAHIDNEVLVENLFLLA